MDWRSSKDIKTKQSSHLPRSLPHTGTPASACCYQRPSPIAPALPPCLSACAAWNRRLVDYSACSSPVSLSHSSSLIKSISISPLARAKEIHLHVNFKQVKLSNVITSGRPTSQTVVGLVGRGGCRDIRRCNPAFPCFRSTALC